MSEYYVVTPQDTAAAEEIIDLATKYLHSLAAEYPQDTYLPRKLREGTIGTAGLCREASSAVTRAAHALGIVASREFHDDGGHYITSFSSLDTPPNDYDPVLCMTWGQFNQALYNGDESPFAGRPFFGSRRDSQQLDLGQDYNLSFAARSVTLRQTICTPYSNGSARYRWLMTTPEEIATGAYPVGEVELRAYAIDHWDHDMLDW